METSTAEVLYTPRSQEHRILPKGINVLPITNAPGYELGYVNSTSNNNGGPGDFVRLKLNTVGTVIIETDIDLTTFSPSFFAYTMKGNRVIAAEKAIWLYRENGRRKLVELPFPDDNAITNNGLVVDSTSVLIVAKSTLDPKKENGPTFLYNVITGQVERLPLMTTNGNGGFLWRGLLYHTDTPTQEVRIFDFLKLANVYRTLFKFEGQNWPEGMVGPFCHGGLHYCAVAVWNSTVGDGKVVVICLETQEVVHEIKVPGAGQVTSLVVRNGWVYMTTALKGLITPEQLKMHPNGGCLFFARAPDELKENPPHVPLLIDIE
jgi:sugar lactone lactonase YvrE